MTPQTFQPVVLPRPHRRRLLRARHRGMTAVIAMIYLGLFSTLAVGFYQATTMSIRVVHNDRDVAMALAAAESGMQYMKYQMSRVSIPPTHTDPAVVVQDVVDDMTVNLASSRDFDGLSVGLDGLVASIPSDPDKAISIPGLGGGAKFRATITGLPGVDNKVVVAVTSTYGETARTIVMDFNRQQIPTTIYNYAVASKGGITLTKGDVTSVDPAESETITAMSAKELTDNAVTVNGGLLGGDLAVLDGSDVDFIKGSVGGSTIASTVMGNVTYMPTAPEFPIVDTSVFKAYATNVYSNKKTQGNIRIPPNTNPKFNGGDTVNGIMYIESPNTVTFTGNFNMAGIIVFENKAGTNVLDFSGNMSQSPAPSGSEYDAVRSASNISILAPTASVTMTGSTGSYLRGSVIVDRYTFAGAADIRIDRGTLMTLNPGLNSAVFKGAKSVKFTATGEDNAPTTGLSYSSYFQPEGSSYQELIQ
jgi:hypothetical protein